jgi:hypothetical protein
MIKRFTHTIEVLPYSASICFDRTDLCARAPSAMATSMDVEKAQENGQKHTPEVLHPNLSMVPRTCAKVRRTWVVFT